MSYKLASEILAEPLTLSEVKAQLRVTVADEDDLISDILFDARSYIERILGVSIIQKRYDLYLDAFPVYDSTKIQLPVSPLDTVDYVKYFDTDDVEQTWSSAEYTVDNTEQLGLIYPGIDYDYPSARIYPKAVNVRYVTGPEQEASDTAQSGTGAEIVLAAADTNADDYYNKMIVFITGGLGAGQYNRITNYVSSTKTATLLDAWGTDLDGTSEYIILQSTVGPLQRAILLLCGHWYENRENMLTGTITSDISMGVNSLIAPYKVFGEI